MKRLVLAVLALVLALTCCLPGMAEATKITVMARRSEAAAADVYKWMAEQMMERYGVDCEIINMPDFDAIKIAFEGGEIPTLVYLDDLWQMTLQKHGYFQDITQYVEQYGWIERSVPGAVEFNNLRTPGRYYSVPMLMAPVVVFYNRDLLEKLDCEVPTTYDEMYAILEKGKAAGYIGIEADGSNMHNIMWSMYNMMFTKVGMEDIRKWYYLEETTDNLRAGLLFAAQEVDKWVKNGFLREEVLGIDDTVLVPLFAQGQSLFLVTGDWHLQSMEDTGLNLGAFAFPTTDTNNPLYIVNATDGAWCLTTSADQAQTEAAMQFIDLCFSQDNIEKWVSVGFTPSVKWDASATQMSPLKREVLACVESAGIGFFLDNAAPGFLDVSIKMTQMLVGGELTPQQYTDQLLAEYDTLKAAQLAIMN